MAASRMRLVPAALLAAALAAAPGWACAGGEDLPPPGPPPVAWQPPARFLAAWFRGGPFWSRGLPRAGSAQVLAAGLALQPVPFLSLEAEGGWISRDFTDEVVGRTTLVSRAATLAVRVRHAFGIVEPSLFAGAVFLDTSRSTVGGGPRDRSTGACTGAGLDLSLVESVALGLEGRWLFAPGIPRSGLTRLSLDGLALTAALRVYYP